MIEGIIGLFVILFLILVVPFIKDWYVRSNTPTEVNHKATPPADPKEGDIWFW